jgi:hypothetical protein
MAKLQSFAWHFSLKLIKIDRCVGTHRQFIKKKRQKICEFPKKALPLPPLS